MTPDNTSAADLESAQRAIREAELGAEKTDAVVSSMLAFAGRIAEMHEENHYVNKLRTIFRGAHNA